MLLKYKNPPNKSTGLFLTKNLTMTKFVLLYNSKPNYYYIMNIFKKLFSKKNKVEATPVVETPSPAKSEPAPAPTLEYLLGEAVQKQDIDEMYRLLELGANPNGKGVYVSPSCTYYNTVIPEMASDCRIMDLNYEYGNSFRPEGLKSTAVDKLLRAYGGTTSYDDYEQCRRELAEAEARKKKDAEKAEEGRQKRVDEILKEKI